MLFATCQVTWFPVLRLEKPNQRRRDSDDQEMGSVLHPKALSWAGDDFVAPGSRTALLYAEGCAVEPAKDHFNHMPG